MGVALILGKSISERLELESKVKKLYSLRSAIVHSGNKSISESDHQSMLGISRAVVAKLLTSNTLKNIDSIEKMYELLKSTKYSGNEI
jgi:DNA-binding transcriptional regulator LsrR (DeoR family)